MDINLESMKFYLSYCFLLLSSICCAQIPKAGDSIPRPAVEKFPGTWKWTSDSAELIIHLAKVTAVFPSKIKEPILVGVHSFKKNGIMLEDHLKEFSSLSPKSPGTILLMAKYDGTNPDEVDGSIQDSLKNKKEYLTLIFNNTGIPSITLYLNHMSDPGKKKEKKSVPDYTFTFPTNIVLVKQ